MTPSSPTPPPPPKKKRGKWRLIVILILIALGSATWYALSQLEEENDFSLLFEKIQLWTGNIKSNKTGETSQSTTPHSSPEMDMEQLFSENDFSDIESDEIFVGSTITVSVMQEWKEEEIYWKIRLIDLRLQTMGEIKVAVNDLRHLSNIAMDDSLIVLLRKEADFLEKLPPRKKLLKIIQEIRHNILSSKAIELEKEMVGNDSFIGMIKSIFNYRRLSSNNTGVERIILTAEELQELDFLLTTGRYSAYWSLLQSLDNRVMNEINRMHLNKLLRYGPVNYRLSLSEIWGE